MGSPQFLKFLKDKVKERLLKNSPCGENVAPTSCLCEDGSSIVPFTGEEEERCPKGLPETCECEDGSIHEIAKGLKAIKEKVQGIFLSKSPCGAGIKPSECSCENGETFTPGVSRNPCNGLPSSCTCPNGETFDGDDVKEIIKTLKD